KRTELHATDRLLDRFDEWAVRAYHRRAGRSTDLKRNFAFPLLLNDKRAADAKDRTNYRQANNRL
ncbi:hypothetical protein, partial [Pandoraea pneumonica]|uniref:hypothetical protein n=1 Tax=Pandoraea pneumonica TaxID=2508299 RepID=UPI003CFA32B9